ncbi:EAL domain-containing protein [Paenibacillus sinopodophylli]|uniref:EAL domain-containing protein n=1 Tax=Paenibacillus sinopodophylli TaxID=1837342 RepID=UPI00110D0B53|nr:EAL domain-containing protein [Paenibacillus sinopodophylli]
MDCHNCGTIPPIQDQGMICLHSTAEAVTLNWHQLVPVLDSVGDLEKVSVYYNSKDELLGIVTKLLEQLNSQEQASVSISFGALHDEMADSGSSRLQLEMFAARIQHHHLVSLIADNHFTSHMQPIMNIDSQRVFGYELLMRPLAGQAAFQPYELFQVAQQTGLHSFLDRSARISAIQASAMHLPKGIKRFINFLPSSIYNPNFCLSHTFEAIERFEQDPADFVFEVVETEKIANIAHLKTIFSVYKEHGIQVALDDVGSGFATLEVLAELKPHFVKIDRGLISGCNQDDHKQQLIAAIVKSAEAFGASVLAEGVEEKEELAFCQSQHISLAQGYLIGKPSSIPLTEKYVSL